MMKRFIFLSSIGLFLGLFVFLACDSKKTSTSNKAIVKKYLTKRWVLTNENGVLENGLPSHVILSLEDNGYFLVYDTIIDNRFLAAGIKRIQPISKGQWKMEKNQLILNHLLPNLSHTEIFLIKSLDRNKLVTIDDKKIRHIYTNLHK